MPTKVDDLAVACSVSTVAQGSIDLIGKIMYLKSQGILSSFNGIDIDQRRENVKVSCQSYLVSMLKTHGWDKPSLTEKSDSKPIGRFHWVATSLVLSEDSWYGIG